jgi:hypothetical protein
MAIIDSLISHWKLDEASGTRSDSHSSNDLTDNNTVTQAVGKISNAGQFTKANSEFLNITDNASLSVGDIDFTIAAWVYADSVPTGSNTHAIVAKDASGVRGYALTVFDSSGAKFAFQVGSDASTFTNHIDSTFGNVPTGEWIYVIAWHDATANTLNIQVNNGTVDSVSYSSGGYDEAQDFRIGQHFGGNNWDGRIDEVSFWKKVLTSQERTDLYNSGDGFAYPWGGSASLSPSASESPSVSPSASLSPSSSASASGSASASASLSPSSSESASASLSGSPSASASASASASESKSLSPSSSASASVSASASASGSASSSASASASESKSASASSSASLSPSASTSASASASGSSSGSASGSASGSSSASKSASASLSPSASASASPSPASYVNKYTTVGNDYTDKYTSTL